MNLGKRILEVRKELEWEQSDLLERVGACQPPGANELSQQALSNLEQRDSKTSEHLFAVADALGVSARWLMTGEGVKEAATEDSIQAVFPSIPDEMWDQLTERQKGMVEEKTRQAIDAILGSTN